MFCPGPFQGVAAKRAQPVGFMEGMFGFAALLACTPDKNPHSLIQQLCREAAVVRFATLKAAVTVLTVDEVTVKQCCFQNPNFDCHPLGLVAGRLSQDVQRIESRTLSTEPPRPQQ
jgi:hypothetical protein